MYEDWSDYLSIIWNFYFGLVGVVLNILLIFLVYKYTPKMMRVYATVIRIGAICDIIISFAAIMVSARIHSSGNSILLMFHGAAKYLPIDRSIIPYICIVLYVFEVHGYMFSVFVILYSLYFRQRMVTNFQNPITQTKVNIVCYGFSFIFSSYTIFIANANCVPYTQIEDAARNIRPELIGSDWIYFVILNVGGLSEAILIVMNPVVLIFGPICSYRVHKTLSSLNMSTSTKELHKALMKILLIQIATPSVQIIAIIIHYISSIWNDLQTPIMENTLELFPILLCSITPVVTIYYIEPYRAAVKRFCGVHDVIPIATVSNSADQI